MPDFVLTAIGAAVALWVAASPAVADPSGAAMSAIVVPGGRDTLRLAGVPDAVPAGLVLPLLVRLLHADPAGSNREQDARLARVREKVSQTTARDANEHIAVPLDESGWTRFLVGHDVRPEDAFRVLLLDREPALALFGLFAMPPSTRAWLLDHADLFHRLAARPAILCAFGRSLRVEGDTVAVPGGAAAAAAWAEIAGVAPTDAVRFVDTVFCRNQGQLTAFYDAVARLTRAQQVAVVGRGAADARAAFAAFVDSLGGWHPAERPFAAPLFDGGLVLDELAVDPDGRPVGPRWRRWWKLALGGDAIPSDTTKLVRGLDRDGDVEVATLVAATTTANVDERRARFERIRFVQRVLPDAEPASAGEALVATRGYARFPALLLALERLGVRDPALLARAVHRAAEIDGIGHEAAWTEAVALFQGALAVLDGIAAARSLPPEDVTRLAASLVAVPLDRGSYHGGIVRWFGVELFPSVATTLQSSSDGTAPERLLVRAWSGPPGTTHPALDWEGQRYIVDPVVAEQERLSKLRTLQGPTGLGESLEVWRAERDPGGDTGRAERSLAAALVSWAYTRHLGDPETTVLEGDGLARRHHFGRASAWMLPRESGDERGRHLQGALLGLDLALARLALRRLSADAVPPPRTINENVLDLLSETVTLAARQPPSDQDLADVASTLEAGRRRVRETTTHSGEIRALAAEALAGEWRTEAAEWIAHAEPERLVTLFGSSELYRIGGGHGVPAALGTSRSGIDGCWCLRVPRERPWEDVAGRPGMPRVAAQLTDLGLTLAEHMHAVHAPAVLYPALLSLAAQDLVDRAAPAFPEDWPALASAASQLTRERVEDFVSALVGTGPLRMPLESRP